MFRKRFHFILTIILFNSLILASTYEPNNAFAFGDKQPDLIVSAEKLYLREGPGLSFPIIKTLKQNQELTFIEKQDDWYHVQAGDEEGWVASWLTSTKKTESEPSISKTAISQVDHLNLRAEPSVNSAILNQLNTGDEAEVLKEQNGWLQINYNGTTGWISSDYVSVNENNSNTNSNLIESSESEEENEDSPSNSSVEIDPNTFTIVVDAVYVRKKADLSSKKLDVVNKGDQFEVLERSNNWVKIQNDQVKGWVYSFYGSFTVNPNQPTSPKDEANSKGDSSNVVTIIYNGTNLREEPSTSSNVVVHANAGEKFSIISSKDDWYEVKVDENTSAFVANWVVSTNEQNTSGQEKKQEERKKGTLKGVTIVLDPGHGGNDMGTTGVRGTDEKDINLKTVELLKSKLRSAGAEVILTRESDVYVDLRKRVSISHQYSADAYISIHYDATEDSSISGFTTYYTNNYQSQLAEYVHDGLAEKVTLRDRGVQPGNYLVLRENKQKAILIELGYLSNPNEERIVTTDYYREQATLGIYQGILNYFDAQLEN